MGGRYRHPLFLIEWLGRETEYFAYEKFAYTGFVFWAGANVIHEILNKKFLTKSSEKVKNGWIVFIVAITIVMIYVLLDWVFLSSNSRSFNFLN